jgi:hypothetical protein
LSLFFKKKLAPYPRCPIHQVFYWFHRRLTDGHWESIFMKLKKVGKNIQSFVCINGATLKCRFTIFRMSHCRVASCRTTKCLHFADTTVIYCPNIKLSTFWHFAKKSAFCCLSFYHPGTHYKIT